MPSNYTGDPTATQSPSPAPGAGVAPVLALPVGTDAFNAAAFYQEYKCLADFIAWLMIKASPSLFFGDGSDGSVTLDGTVAAPSWATKAGSNYTATRDAFCINLTVTGASTTLDMNGYRLYCTGTLTTASGGIIHANGSSGASGGAARPTGTLAGSGAGGTGSGGAGGATTNSYGGNGGAGGGAGSGGTATAPTAAKGSARSSFGSLFGQLCGLSVVTAYTGGGGGTASSSSAGGGAGGGPLAIAARTLNLQTAGSLSAAGGAGANGGTGGGGGGGGVLDLMYQSKNSVTFSAATNCPGGTGGTGSPAGSNGSNGTVFERALTL